MNDYIRKAVELAGWNVRDSGQVIEGIDGYFGHIDDQAVRDSLAAHLVRQVDAMERWMVDVECDGTDILDDYDRGSLKAQSLGPDRTMNTIKAIVDSKVLEDTK